MIDPPRLRDGGSHAAPELADLFRAARKPETLPSAIDARQLAKLTALGALPAAPLSKALPWLLAGGTVVLAGALALVTQGEKAPRPAPSPPSATSAAAAVHPGSTAEAPPESPTPSEAERQFPPVPAPAVSAMPAVPARAARPVPAEAPSVSGDALAGEAKLLNEAHAVMASDPDRALAIAGEHAKRYPRGQLAAERELIRVQALVKLGRTAEAEARARALRKSTPSSIYGERLDTILKGK